jgi:hypothetical protein
MRTCFYLAGILGAVSMSAQAETISYTCTANQPLRIEYSADGKTAAGLNDLNNIALVGRTAVAGEGEAGVNFISEDPKWGPPITITGSSKSQVTVRHGRRSFECAAAK